MFEVRKASGGADPLSPDALSVTRALGELCRAAGVSPDDGSDAAGRRVIDALTRSAGAGEHADPQRCTVSAWLRHTTGLTNEFPDPDPSRALLLLTPARVLVLGPKPRTAPRPTELVELPPALAAAVRVADAWGTFPPVPRVRKRARAGRAGEPRPVRASADVTINCPVCGVGRVLRIYPEPGAIAKSQRRPCGPCSNKQRRAQLPVAGEGEGTR